MHDIQMLVVKNKKHGNAIFLLLLQVIEVTELSPTEHKNYNCFLSHIWRRPVVNYIFYERKKKDFFMFYTEKKFQ